MNIGLPVSKKHIININNIKGLNKNNIIDEKKYHKIG